MKAASKLPPAHLQNRSKEVIALNNASSKGNHLNEIRFKDKLEGTINPKRRIDLIINVINYLDVENSLRYSPVLNINMANIYISDLAYLLQIYIPRVWWTKNAISTLNDGINIYPIYNKNVTELTANQIFLWFEKYGQEFNWSSTQNYKTLKRAVKNIGTIGIITAYNKKHSGHIAALYISKYSKWKKNLHQTRAGQKRYLKTNDKWWKEYDQVAFYYYNIIP